MRELILFIIIACVALAVCLLSLLELFFTVRRRRASEKLHQDLRDLRAAYNESINKLVLEQDADSFEDRPAIGETPEPGVDRKAIEEEYKLKYEGLEAKNKRALESARKKAKTLEDEAKQQADQYLSSRKKEIEEELMGLVLSVSKKVLPAGISYDAHKELVMQALREVKTEES